MSRAPRRVFEMRRRIAIMLVIAQVASAPGSALAQDASPDLSASLLQAADVPAGFTSTGAHAGSDLDPDQSAFDAAGGLAAATQAWVGPRVTGTESLVQVVDIRFLFPDADAAQAYLAAAGPVLGEAAAGSTSAPDPGIGDDSSASVGTQQAGDVLATFEDVLFRTGPLVGRVRLSGFGTTDADVAPIVALATTRARGWLAAIPPAAGGSLPPSGSTYRQWATSATASSQYGTPGWAAMAATGAPDVPAYGDDQRAWAPQVADGTTDQLELGYAQAVVPTEVGIVESFGNGDVTQVELHDPDTDAWVIVWSSIDPTGPDLATFRPDITPVDFATDRVRVTLGDVVAGWSEIDAVELVGTVP